MRCLFRLGARKWNEKRSSGGPRCSEMKSRTVHAAGNRALSRLNITLYSVERRAINNVEKCAYSRTLNRLSNSVLICHGIGRRGARLCFHSLLEGRFPPNRYATFRSKTLHLHWTVFRARSVRLIDLEPCLKFTWVMSMKLERMIARLECSSSSLFLHGRHGKITRILIRLCEYCKISYRELLFTIGRKRRIELIWWNFV